jgi:hypothetical protein
VLPFIIGVVLSAIFSSVLFPNITVAPCGTFIASPFVAFTSPSNIVTVACESGAINIAFVVPSTVVFAPEIVTFPSITFNAFPFDDSTVPFVIFNVPSVSIPFSFPETIPPFTFTVPVSLFTIAVSCDVTSPPDTVKVPLFSIPASLPLTVPSVTINVAGLSFSIATLFGELTIALFISNLLLFTTVGLVVDVLVISPFPFFH